MSVPDPERTLSEPLAMAITSADWRRYDPFSRTMPRSIDC